MIEADSPLFRACVAAATEQGACFWASEWPRQIGESDRAEFLYCAESQGNPGSVAVIKADSAYDAESETIALWLYELDDDARAYAELKMLGSTQRKPDHVFANAKEFRKWIRSQ